MSLLHERRKCLGMETHEAIKQTAQATKSIWGQICFMTYIFTSEVLMLFIITNVFLVTSRRKKKGLEFPIPETYMGMKSKVESETCHLVTWISLYVKFDHFKDL